MYGAAAADEASLTRATEADNRMRWNGGPGHYEVWYLTCNHRASRVGLWLRYTLEAPTHGEPYVQLWFAAFYKDDPKRNFGINKKLPVGSLVAPAAPAPFSLEMGEGNLLEQDGAKGSIEGGGHRVRWDLSWLPAARTHRWLPDVIYRTSIADSRALSPNHDVPIRGTVQIDEETLTFDGEPGGQTHIWGRKHLFGWAWGHCNAFDGRRGAAFETLTARIERRGVTLPPLTLLTLYLDGEELRFTDFTDTLLGRGRWGTGRYELSAQGLYARVSGEYTCRPADMIQAEYVDPDGAPAWCCNTEVADLRLTVWRRSFLGAWHEQTRLSATGTGHFEVGGRSPDGAVTTRHMPV